MFGLGLGVVHVAVRVLVIRRRSPNLEDLDALTLIGLVGDFIPRAIAIRTLSRFVTFTVYAPLLSLGVRLASWGDIAL